MTQYLPVDKYAFWLMLVFFSLLEIRATIIKQSKDADGFVRSAPSEVKGRKEAEEKRREEFLSNRQRAELFKKVISASVFVKAADK